MSRPNIDPGGYWLARTLGGGDIARIASYIGKSNVFASALAEFSEAYGDQTERDHASFLAAVRTRRIEALGEGDL